MKNGKQNMDRRKQGQREKKRTNLVKMVKAGTQEKGEHRQREQENGPTGRRAKRRDGWSGQGQRQGECESGVPEIVDRGARNTNAR